MPEFIRPQRAIIETGGGFDPGPAVLLGAVVLVIGTVVAFVMAHLVLIAICAVILAALGTAGVCILRRFMVVVHEKAPEPALPLAVQAAVAAPPRVAIAPVVHHQHLHLHGLPGDEIAAIVSQVTNVPPDSMRPSRHALPRTDHI